MPKLSDHLPNDISCCQVGRVRKFLKWWRNKGQHTICKLAYTIMMPSPADSNPLPTLKEQWKWLEHFKKAVWKYSQCSCGQPKRKWWYCQRKWQPKAKIFRQCSIYFRRNHCCNIEETGHLVHSCPLKSVLPPKWVSIGGFNSWKTALSKSNVISNLFSKENRLGTNYIWSLTCFGWSERQDVWNLN